MPMLQNKILFFTEDNTYRIRKKRILREWLFEVIGAESKRVGEINIILCSDEYLHKINLEYLNHDTLTDIVTFDSTEDNIISGELYISIERVIDNAKVFSTFTRDELHRVIVHGVLHLCGFGDKTEKEKELMTSKENFYLALRPLNING